MPFEEVKKVWMNGRLVDFADAKIHVFTHAVHYGSGLFEGIRCYNTKRGPAIFRLEDHTRRLFDSSKIYRMDLPYTPAEINDACTEIVRANEFEDCYLRPVVYRGYHSLGVFPGACPVDVVIGPRLPAPIVILSTERMGETSAAVPVKNTSSAT